MSDIRAMQGVNMSDHVRLKFNSKLLHSSGFGVLARKTFSTSLIKVLSSKRNITIFTFPYSSDQFKKFWKNKIDNASRRPNAFILFFRDDNKCYNKPSSFN